MGYVQPAQFARSLESLIAVPSPLLLVTIPALLAEQVPLVATQAAADAVNPTGPKLSGPLEKKFLDAYFSFPGAPAGKRYLVPGSGWVNPDFHSSSLQAQRSERLGTVFFRSGGRADSRYYPAGTDWADFAERLTRRPKEVLHTDAAGAPELVPLFDLACWLYRDVDVADADALLQHALTALHIDTSLVGTLFDIAIPADAEAIALGADVMDAAAIAEILDVPAPPPEAPPTIEALVQKIESSLTAEKLELAEGVVASIVHAWLARDIVVLVGAPGTGKSTLAEGVARALSDVAPDERYVRVPVGEDWTSAELIGYENLAGSFVPRPLAAKILQSSTPAYPHVVLLEEFNLSKAEHYLSALLHAVESEVPVIPLSGAAHGFLPIDTLVIATGNSPRDEPTTRIPLSGPSIQRMSVIEMPNILRTRWDTEGEFGIREVITSVLQVDARALQKRAAAGAATWLDGLRANCLGARPTVDDLDQDAAAALTNLVAELLGTPEGARWMTMRPLRDIAVRMYFSEPSEQGAELCTVVRQKLIHLAKEASTLATIVEACAFLPGHEALEASVAAMSTEYGIAPIV